MVWYGTVKIEYYIEIDVFSPWFIRLYQFTVTVIYAMVTNLSNHYISKIIIKISNQIELMWYDNGIVRGGAKIRSLVVLNQFVWGPQIDIHKKILNF